MITIYDRKNKKYYSETQCCGKTLNFLYNTVLGRSVLKIITFPFFSKIIGLYYDSGLSKRKINKFIKKNNIDINLYEDKKYKNFNEFFYRDKKNKLQEKDKNIFISPADSKVLLYKIDDNLKIKVKNVTYDLNELTKDNYVISEYKNGNCIVFRLSVDQFHRYCNIDDGELISHKYIKGKLHTVCSISEKYKIYIENSRVINYIKTDNFSDIIQIEVGALLVGKVTNNYNSNFKKSSEKGYFEYGGSTIIIITKDNIKFDKDIIENSKKLIETKVEYGERIGIKK